MRMLASVQCLPRRITSSCRLRALVTDLPPLRILPVAPQPLRWLTSVNTRSASMSCSNIGAAQAVASYD